MKKYKRDRKHLIHRFRHLYGTFHDVDYRILHACFDFLCDFVEKEKGLEVLKYQWTYWNTMPAKERKNMGCIVGQTKKRANECWKIWDEATALYNWWNDEFLPANKKGDWDMPGSNDSKIENKQLIRLIKIRKYLWT